MSGTVKIHGKDYKTVALRVTEFREAHKDYSILTEIVSNENDTVIMKASIEYMGHVLATGFAEERRDATQINKTSALENCETSAIGRALASFGFGGTEYASDNEVQQAIVQQEVDKANSFYVAMNAVLEKTLIQSWLLKLHSCKRIIRQRQRRG